MQLHHALRVGAGDVISFTGGGGKTTAMFRLAAELAATGLRVVSTTSTRIFAAQTSMVPFHLETNGTVLPDRAQLRDLLTEWGQVLVTGPVGAETGKAAGVTLDVIEEIHRLPGVDVVLVEADGSRMRPLKAPAAHEPVVPASTTILVPLVGLDALGNPLDDEHVHRAAIVSQLTGLAVGSQVDDASVAGLLMHPDGGAKACPAGARLVPLLNKLDLLAPAGSSDLPVVVQDIVTRLLGNARVDEVVVGAVRGPDPVAEVCGRVAGVILAAGAGQRFGGLKQLATWHGQPLLQHVVTAALASGTLDPVVVVLGHEADQILPVLQPFASRINVVHNAAWTQGQATSLHAALRTFEHGSPSVSAVVFLLADQPDVAPGAIDALAAAHRRSLADVVVPHYRGQRGNPVLFDRTTFGALRALRGDTGGRALLREPAWHVMAVDFDRPPPHDIDTQADLNGL